MPYRSLFTIPSRRHFSISFSPHHTPLIPNKDIKVRLMTKDDSKMVMGWAAKEGWNPGKYEVEPLYVADSTGYHLLEIDGEPVASLASVKHSQNFAFLGLYIVKPEYRGKGYGKLLWDIVMGTLKDCTTLGLNGVIDQVENYKRSGFMPATLNTRWRGRPSLKFFGNINNTVLNNISVTKDFSLTSMIDYDAKIFANPRAVFLSQWLKMPESHVLAAIEGGVLRGYGSLSVSEEGYKVAPLFADNEAIAEKLYVALCHYTANKGYIQIDTNENNPFAAALAKRFGLEKMFDTLCMYKGVAPGMEDKKIFGLTTLEIG